VKIIVDRLSQSPVSEVFEASANWWRERTALDSGESTHLDCEILTPFQFSLRSYLIGADVVLEGGVVGEIEVECGRCLARYRHALRDQFRLVAEEAKGRVPPDPEGQECLTRFGLCLTDEIETGWYRGGVIELDGFFTEVIAGMMPLHSVCKEDCRGLCPVCGVSRNDTHCECDVEAATPKKVSPFAVLAQLRQ
jgi:uncharacterized protein